ncbi:MAG TPA: TIGR02453 family protein [Gemmatimonadales bacterium]|nr:TIGR02453 family protein [Gemmatimonadales bacterium]
MPWHVYLARCRDGTLYTGITTDPVRREAAHNAGRGAGYTRSRRPVRLIHLEPATDRSAALRREHAIKRMTRPMKEQLVKASSSRARRAGGSDAPAAGDFRGFRPQAVGFLRRLARHNTREWFERNRAVYQLEVRDPLRALVEEMDVRLARIAPELVGDPRRSIFRIHRDVRFSADKSPYKTNAACQFYHADAGRGAGQDAEAAGAGLYFQLADGDCFVAGGIWMPARPALEKIRQALADDPGSLDRIVAAPTFRRRFKAITEEAMLTRLPRGYQEGHPAARWLRYKSFTAYRALTEPEIESPRLPLTLERDFAALVPLVRWLNGAIGYRAADRRY